VLQAGDVVWTTAGSGVIHNEDVEPVGKSRILQLWFTIPSESRWSPPRLEHISRDSVPVRSEPGIEARVYSGSSGAVRTKSYSYLPMTMVDVRLDAGAVFMQELPASYNGFVYVLEGDVVAGASSETALNTGQVGWLNRADGGDSTVLHLTARSEGARVVLYAGERQNVPIVMHGPFVGETRRDLHRVSRDFMEGRMPHLSEVMAQTRVD
jgi:quercetin 2,3-dioxygenase